MSAFTLPRFYPIVDTAAAAKLELGCVDVGRVLLDAGVRILQYRHKEPWLQNHYDEAEKIGSLCVDAGATFVLNDRADFATLLNAGLHVGQEDLPPVAARGIVGDAVIGFSTHNKRQLLHAANEPIQYVAIGPVFATGSKENPDAELGLERLRLLRALTKQPTVAIGGISLERAEAVLATGVDSVAVISGYLGNRSELATKVTDWMRVTG